MVVGACVGAGDAGRGGEGKGATFCLQVWESVVSAGWGRARRLFPSAGKQCPRRVFYGSCWTLISFVARLSSAAAALSPQKRAPPPSPPESHAPRVYDLTRRLQRPSQYPLRESV